MFHDTADDHRPARRPPRARRPHRDRRLRHRLLVARLPAPVPGRHAQDRPRVHRPGDGELRGLGIRPRDRRARPDARTCASSPRASRSRTSSTGCAQLGCEFGQGFLFARPMSASAIQALIVGGLPADSRDTAPRPSCPPTTSPGGAARHPFAHWRRGRSRLRPELPGLGASMFILYAILAGLLVGWLSGGPIARLATCRLRWGRLIVGGLLAQVVLFSDPVAERVGDLRALRSTSRSTVAVVVAVLRQLAHRRALPILAVGAASNLRRRSWPTAASCRRPPRRLHALGKELRRPSTPTARSWPTRRSSS